MERSRRRTFLEEHIGDSFELSEVHVRNIDNISGKFHRGILKSNRYTVKCPTTNDRLMITKINTTIIS